MNDLPECQEFLVERGIEVEYRDIVKDPPSREFLESHVDPARFLEFLSRRSPVFKTRPLPASKKEAIALMLEQPNLIKRPIFVKGAKPIFGFDQDAYAKLV